MLVLARTGLKEPRRCQACHHDEDEHQAPFESSPYAPAGAKPASRLCLNIECDSCPGYTDVVPARPYNNPSGTKSWNRRKQGASRGEFTEQYRGWTIANNMVTQVTPDTHFEGSRSVLLYAPDSNRPRSVQGVNQEASIELAKRIVDYDMDIAEPLYRDAEEAYRLAEAIAANRAEVEGKNLPAIPTPGQVAQKLKAARAVERDSRVILPPVQAESPGQHVIAAQRAKNRAETGKKPVLTPAERSKRYRQAKKERDAGAEERDA